MFYRPDLSHPKITNRCGLRFNPFEIKVKFPINCFLHSINNITVFDIERHIMNDLNTIRSRITGGELTEYRESPWTVHIAIKDGFFRTDHHCTGVLLTLKYILTAAHCFE